MEGLEELFVHPARARGRYAIHDACESDDLEQLREALAVSEREKESLQSQLLTEDFPVPPTNSGSATKNGCQDNAAESK